MGLKEFIKDRLRTEVKIEDYLNNLSPEDAGNIRSVLDSIEGQHDVIGGELLVVGSSAHMRAEYDDIDLKVVREAKVNCDEINDPATVLVRSALGGERCEFVEEYVVDAFGRRQKSFRIFPQSGASIHLVPSYRDDPTPDSLRGIADFERNRYVRLGRI